MTAIDATSREAVRALEENLWSLWANFGRGPGCALVDEPGLLRFDTPIRQVPYNTVLRFRCRGDVDEEIDAILAHYRARDVAPLWVVHPTARPGDLAARLARRGLAHAESVHGMVRGLEELPGAEPLPVGIEVEEASAEGDDEVTELVAWRYALAREAHETLRSIYRVLGVGSPGAGTRIWVARQRGRAVSKAVLHVDGGVAGLYGVATKPEARGLGLARTLTLRALEAARETGCGLGVLHSTPMAIGLYRALGFGAVADFELFAAPGALQL